MLLRPDAFRRLWACGLALGLLAGACILAMEPSHAASVRASFYGAESGRRTASGLPFRPEGFTAAHRSLPFGTRLRVCLDRCIVVTVTDRGPFAPGRSLDLSHGAARAIGLLRRGVAVITADRF